MASIFGIQLPSIFGGGKKQPSYPNNFVGPKPMSPTPVITPPQPLQQGSVMGAQISTQPVYGPKPTYGPQAATNPVPTPTSTGSTSRGGGGLQFNIPGSVPGADGFNVPQDLLAQTNGLSSADYQNQIDQFSYDQLIAPALNALSEYERTLQTGLDVSTNAINTDSAGILSNIQGGKQESLGTLDSQQKSAEERAKVASGQVERGENEAVAEQRRLLDETTTGLQARFGGTTGTGRFASEIASRGTQTNIAGIRGAALGAIENNQSALNSAVREIDAARNNIISQANRLVTQEEQRASQAKEEAKQRLREQLVEIGMRKGELEGRKAEARLNVLKDARDFIANIESQNRAVKQDAFNRADSYIKDLEMMKNQAQIQFQMSLQNTIKPTRQVQVMTPERALELGSIPEDAQILNMPGTTQLQQSIMDIWNKTNQGSGEDDLVQTVGF